MKLKYLHQENNLYNPYINKWGCYLLSILRIVEETNYKSFTSHEVLNFYNLFSKNKWIDTNCRILLPDSIFSFFNITVATSHQNKDYRLQENDMEFFISKIDIANETGHFILCQGIFNEPLSTLNKIWDSLFLKQNRHSLCKDAFRIFRKI